VWSYITWYTPRGKGHEEKENEGGGGEMEMLFLRLSCYENLSVDV
jgi:hypothetical protein